jgi:hypothetical protein
MARLFHLLWTLALVIAGTAMAQSSYATYNAWTNPGCLAHPTPSRYPQLTPRAVLLETVSSKLAVVLSLREMRLISRNDDVKYPLCLGTDTMQTYLEPQ